MKKIFSLFVIALFSVSMFATTWTVAGSNTAILGSEWSATDTNNDMVQDGTYWYLVKSGFANESGLELKFKICQDHAWTTAYPASDYEITIPAGNTKVHFMFNTEGNSVACAYSFSVVGSSVALFGAEWDPQVNDMNESAGIYTWTKTDVELAAGTIEFKVAANHAWGHAWPGDNYELAIPTSGIYDVTITFDPAKQQVSAVANKKEDIVVVPTIRLHGNFTGDWADTEEFEIDGKKETASLTLYDLQAGNYEFGVKKDGTWVSNGAEFTRNSASHEVVAGDGNLTIAVDKTGDYTFTWTYDSNTLEVTYPTATALDNTADEAKAVKRIVNGQMVIEKAGVRYSVLGAEIK